MKIPEIVQREPLPVEAKVSKLSKVTLARNPHPALLKEPAQFWDEIFIANEAYVLEEVTHPRVRHVLAYDAVSHRLFLEFVDAPTLHDLVKTGVTIQDPTLTHQILQSVAETVADLHAGIFCNRPIVHNDLKSLNVLVSADAPREAKLIDFTHSYFEGRLPPFISDNQHSPTGTAKYLAPEKWGGNFEHGFKGDVFAFGVLAYYACTGKHPFDGDAAQIEHQIKESTPPSPLDLGVRVLRSTLATIMSCLEKQPSRRPTMQQVAQCYADSASLFS
jgi:serine/threonine protein kinase